MTLATNIYARISALETVAGDLDSVLTSLDTGANPLQLASGTGSSLADVVFSDTRTLAASATETLDLNALTDSAGRTRNFVKVKALLITASSANTNSVIVGNAASNQFQGPFDAATDTVTLPPGGILMLAAPVSGWASTNGASDKLKIANSAGTTGVDYNITIIGTSA